MWRKYACDLQKMLKDWNQSGHPALMKDIKRTLGNNNYDIAVENGRRAYEANPVTTALTSLPPPNAVVNPTIEATALEEMRTVMSPAQQREWWFGKYA